MSANSPAAPAAKKTAKGAAQKTGSKSGGVPTKAGWYVVGLRSAEGQPPPRHAVTFGGISFPEYAYDENPTINNDSIEFNQRRRGQRIYLDDMDLESLRSALGTKIVRTRSAKGARYAILRTDSRAAQRRLKGDMPLERFLYIHPSEEPSEALEANESDVPDSLG